VLFVLMFALAFFGSYWGWDFVAARIGKVPATGVVIAAVLLIFLILPLGIVMMLALDICGCLEIERRRNAGQRLW
jgi:hypothetical protein